MDQHSPPGPVLAVDLGNTTAKMARVSAGEVEVFWVAPTRVPLAPAVPLLPGSVAYVASVRGDVLPDLERLLAASTGRAPRVLGRDLTVPLELDYETPDTLGVDRLLAALAAFREFPGGAVVLDAGSALTVDWVDGSGRFRGGAIAPGPAALIPALQAAAPGLEWGGLDPAVKWPGTTSERSCVAGLTGTVRGQARELARWAREIAGASLPLVLTGGSAEILVKLLPEFAFVHRPHLVFAGIGLVALTDHE